MTHAAHPTLSDKVRFGLVGFGAWGQQHAQAISRNPHADLVAIVAPSEASRAAATSAFPTAHVFGSHRELLEQSPCDVIDIVTPSHTHLEIASDALHAGKHVLLEKPMALSVADCRTLVDLAASKQKLLAVGHELRLSSQWGHVKQLLDEGVVGRPLYVLVELSRKPYRLGASGWRYDAARVGSWVLEEPIHFFDLARWYLSSEGEPVEVTAVANSRDSARPNLFDNFSAIVKHASGTYAVVSQTLAAFEHHQTVKITGTRGAIWAGWSGALDRTLEPSYFLKVFDGEKLETVPLQTHSGEVFELRQEIDMVIQSLRSGTPPAATGQDGLWSVGLCLAAEESIRRNAAVRMNEFLKS